MEKKELEEQGKALFKREKDVERLIKNEAEVKFETKREKWRKQANEWKQAYIQKTNFEIQFWRLFAILLILLGVIEPFVPTASELYQRIFL